MSQLRSIIRKYEHALGEGKEISIGTKDSVIHVLKKKDEKAEPDLEIYVSPFDETVTLTTDAFLDQN